MAESKHSLAELLQKKMEKQKFFKICHNAVVFTRYCANSATHMDFNYITMNTHPIIINILTLKNCSIKNNFTKINLHY